MMTSENEFRKSVVILFGAALTLQNFERLGINQLSRHFEIHLYDCRDMLRRSSDESSQSVVEFGSYYKIASIESFKINLAKIRPDYVLDAIGGDSLTESIRAALQETRSIYIHWSPAPLTQPTISSRLLFFIYKLHRGSPPKKIPSPKQMKSHNFLKPKKIYLIDRLFRPINEQLRINRLSKLGPTIALLSGRKTLNKYAKKAEEIIWSAGQDYYSYLEANVKIQEKMTDTVDNSYILFIDDNLPNASDWALLYQQPPVSEETYYANLTDCFDRIESRYNLQIIIAGHPNSFHDHNISSKMGGRSVYFGQTASLAIRSSLVLVHASTAVSFAVLARKPLIFLISKELNKSATGMIIRSASQRLGGALVFIDNPYAKINPLHKLGVNPKKYLKYEQNYIRSDKCHENKPWDSLINYIESN